MSESRNLIRVVPPKGETGKPLFSMGTKVFVGDKELSNISSIQLIAEVGKPWRAIVEFSMVEMIDPEAAELSEKEVDITTLGDKERQYMKLQES